MTGIHRFFFSKKMRLTNGDDFNDVFKKSKKIMNNVFIMFSKNNEFDFPRIGVVVSKKVSKYAYKRNFVKRFIKESFRLMQYRLFSYDFIIVAKPQVLQFNTLILRQLLDVLWIRFSQKIYPSQSF